VGVRGVLQPGALLGQQGGIGGLHHEVERLGAAEFVVVETPPAFVEGLQPKVVALDPQWPRPQRKRLQRAVPEADVGDPGLTQLDQQHEVAADREVAPELAHRRPGHAGHLEADFGQGRAEQAVHLVAPAPTAPGDDLVERGLRVGGQRPAELDVQGLVGNGQHMRPVQGAQRRRVGPRLAFEADPVEIGLQIHGGPNPPWPAALRR
jgi:hypothetical protein